MSVRVASTSSHRPASTRWYGGGAHPRAAASDPGWVAGRDRRSRGSGRRAAPPPGRGSRRTPGRSRRPDPRDRPSPGHSEESPARWRRPGTSGRPQGRSPQPRRAGSRAVVPRPVPRRWDPRTVLPARGGGSVMSHLRRCRPQASPHRSAPGRVDRPPGTGRDLPAGHRGQAPVAVRRFGLPATGIRWGSRITAATTAPENAVRAATAKNAVLMPATSARMPATSPPTA
jgi:hypothetical protein